MDKDNWKAYVALGIVCIVWGTTYLALRIAVLHFPPFLFTAIRQVTSGILLLSIMMWVVRKPFPTVDILWRQAIGGFFMISLGNGLVAWAEVHIPSGIAAIICSLVPVLVILTNVAVHRDDRPTPPIMVGVGMGLLGILIIFSENLAAFAKAEYGVGIALTFLAAISWAGGSVWIKRKNTESDPFVNASLQMFFGGLWLIPFSLAFDDLSSVTWSEEAGYSLAYLILFGSLLAYASYAYALRRLPMSVVSMYAYVNPVVAILLGWVVLGEAFNVKIALAMSITILGIYIVNRGFPFPKVWKLFSTTPQA